MTPILDKVKKQQEDEIKIMAAIIEARESRSSSRLIVEFSDNGGVMTIIVESKKRFK